MLELFLHPLSSYCHKALIALYENQIGFQPRLLGPDDPASAEEFQRISLTGKFPLLRDSQRNCVVGETSVIIEYLQTFYGGPVRLIPDDPEQAWQVRMWDRLLDNYLHSPMQAIVADRLRAPEVRDPHGVSQARQRIRQTYARLESQLASPWLLGQHYSLADCAASPALFYADLAEPMAGEFPRTLAYLNRLVERPGYARALREAEPFFSMFPLEPKPRLGARL